MTTTPPHKPGELHPLRCETCKNPDCPAWIGMNLEIAQSGRLNTHHIAAVVATVGCASHSSAQQQAPAQSIQACLAPVYHSCNYKGSTYHTQSPTIAAQARKEGYAEGAAAERERVLESLIARIDQELTDLRGKPGYHANSAYLAVLAWCCGLKAGGEL